MVRFISFIILYSSLLLSFPLENESEKKNSLIVYFQNDIDTSGGWISPGLFEALNKLSDELYYKIKSSSLIQNLDEDSNCSCLPDSVYIISPEGLKANCPCNKNFSPGYFIIGSIKSYNQLIYASAKIYFVYQDSALKYLELFELRTKYYNKNGLRGSTLNERIISEILRQLKAGFDDNINVVVNPIKIDILKEDYRFLKNAVPEYLKSRFVISDKIKVHKDTIITSIPGLLKKPQYTVDGYVFDDRNRVHIIVYCNDNEEDRVILSKQISFNIENPDGLEIKLLEIGDEFRNAILNLYNSKIHKRKTGIAIIAVPPFFSNPENQDVDGMKSIIKKIIFSFISSFRADSIMITKFEFIRDPNYFNMIDEYLNNNREFSVITNELNAEKLVILQTIGNPEEFDLSLQLYDPKANNELDKIDYIRKIKFDTSLTVINSAYVEMKSKLLESINVQYDPTTQKSENEPSEFYELIPKNLGVEIRGLHSLFFDNRANLFLGNHLRPAFEIAGYYSFSFFDKPFSLNISFMYDFGHSRNYMDYDSTDHTGSVYARNLNFILKGYYPFYPRIKNRWRAYFGAGLTLIDIHRVSTNISSGSFEPGFITTIGGEYNLTSKLFIDISARFLASGIKFNTLNELTDTGDKGFYSVFYLGAGIGVDF